MIKKYQIPAAVLLLGIAGAFLRAAQLATAFDGAGLPVSFNLPGLVLLLLSAAALAAAAAIGFFLVPRDLEARPALPARHALTVTALRCLSGLILLISAFSLDGGSDLASVILTAFGALSGASLIALGVMDLLKTGETARLIPELVPAVFFALRMALAYREGSGDPVLLRYAYRCVALGLAALYFTFAAGFTFRRPSPRLTAFFGLASLFFLAVDVADCENAGQLGAHIAVLVFILLGIAPLMPPGPSDSPAPKPPRNENG